MKAKILDIQGKEKGSVELPDEFSARIREDVVAKVLEAMKKIQPYAPSPVAGKQHSASGIISHRRHTWKGHYGYGVSRVPRKIFSRRGNRFNWEAAEVSSAKGGRRAHPPKILSMINAKKINKKEMRLAFVSALSATASEKRIQDKYSTLKNEKIQNLPFVVESKIAGLKTKELVSSLRKILGEKLFSVAEKRRKTRSGKGKLRGRRRKSNAGVLIVTGQKEKIKTKTFDTASAGNVSVNELANSGLGRLVIYTENAIKELSERFNNSSKRGQIKEIRERLK